MPPLRCNDCRFFQPTEHTSGTCHRFPPAFAGEHSPREDHRWRFPVVSELSWCGEHQLREPFP